MPQAALEEKLVQEAVKGYSRANGICLLLSLLGVSPCFLLGDWVSLLIAYGILWCAGTLAAYQQIFIHFHRIVYQMKQERRWFVGERHVLHVDLELSRQKSRMSLPRPILLVPIALTCLIGIFLWVSRKASAASWLLLAGCLFGNLLFFLLSHIVCRGKAKTYCENTAVNLACNRVGYWGWSFCFFLL